MQQQGSSSAVWSVPAAAFGDSDSVRVVRLNVRKGTSLNTDQLVCVVEPIAASTTSTTTTTSSSTSSSSSKCFDVRAPRELEGRVVTELLAAVGAVLLRAQAALLVHAPCPHSLVVRGLCASCGADLSRVRSSDSAQRVQLLPQQADFLFSRNRAAAVADLVQQRLLGSRKLALVLDLDLTLLHCTADVRHAAVLHKAPAADVEDISRFRLGRFEHIVKFRPGLFGFLARLNEFFEMHVFTHGKRDYGWKIAELLDPTNTFFSAQEGVGERRVTTLDDAYSDREVTDKLANGLREYKKIERLFPVSDRMVLVLDDNNVWGDSPNVIRVEPFIFWNSHLPREHVGEFVTNEVIDAIPLANLYFSASARDTHLQDLEALLMRIHTKFFEDPSVHVAHVFANVRKEIFSGCKFVFSGVIPQQTDLSRDPIWRLAELYGAECTDDVTEPGVTHVIATCSGTTKVKSAPSNVVIIHAWWFVECIRKYRRLEEAVFVKAVRSERFVLDRAITNLLDQMCSAFENLPKSETDTTTSATTTATKDASEMTMNNNKRENLEPALKQQKMAEEKSVSSIDEDDMELFMTMNEHIENEDSN